MTPARIVIARAKAEERERIITLIQNKAIKTDAPVRLVSELTALINEIKGDNK